MQGFDISVLLTWTLKTKSFDGANFAISDGASVVMIANYGELVMGNDHRFRGIVYESCVIG